MKGDLGGNLLMSRKWIDGMGKAFIASVGVCFALLLTGGITARAENVEVVPFDKITQEDLDKAYGPGQKYVDKVKDYKYANYINELLKKYDTITFKSGETFTLEYSMEIPSDRAITINADGATIISQKGTVSNADFTITDYQAIKGLSINGGTWKSSTNEGYKGSSFKLAHGQNISFNKMDIQNTNMGSHSIEVVACKNVVIDGCTIQGLGSASGREEQVQIDLAAPGTAGNFLSGAALNGATCQNVTIQNCTITGNKGIGINADGKTSASSVKKANGGKYPNKYHKNITVANNTITGQKGEGLMAYNVIGLVVTDNNIVSKLSAKKGNISAGIHYLNQGKGKKMTATIKNNTVKGGKYAIFVGTNSAKIKKVVITNNTTKCKGAKGNSAVDVSGCKKSVVKKNR